MRVADIAADILTENGIENVFMITGGGAMHLNDALGKKEGLKCLYQHHEQACAMAAEGYARIKGKMACVCVTTGPGGTNAITGVLGAFTDSIPMLVISGQVRFDTTVPSCGLNLRQLGDQEYNIINSVRSMTKYSVTVTDPLEIGYHLNKAIYLAKNGRPGPVWIDIPLNIQAAQVDKKDLRPYSFEEDRQREYPAEVGADVINAAISKLQGAKRPLILAGLGVRKANAYGEFVRLIEKANIPVATAWNAHDLVETDNALYAGKPATVGDRAGNLAVQNCDVLLILGSRLNIRQISYNYEKWSRNSYKIYVDIDECELNKPTLNIDMKIRADLKDFMFKLEKSITPVKTTQWHSYIKDNKERFNVVLKDYYCTETPLNPYCFFNNLFETMPDGQITVMSNGSACVMGLQASITKKGSRYFTNDGCASMGYGLPAAIGAATAANGNPVICIEGDGSLQMNIQELQTVVTNKLNIKIFVINNNGYHSIRQTQTNFFGKPLVGVGEDSGDLSFPELSGIAAAYKLDYVKIDCLTDCNGSIESVLAMPGAVLCEVIVDPEQIFSPKLSSRRLADGRMVSPGLEDMYPFLERDELDKLMFVPMLDD